MQKIIPDERLEGESTFTISMGKKTRLFVVYER